MTGTVGTSFCEIISRFIMSTWRMNIRIILGIFSHWDLCSRYSNFKTNLENQKERIMLKTIHEFMKKSSYKLEHWKKVISYFLNFLTSAYAVKLLINITNRQIANWSLHSRLEECSKISYHSKNPCVVNSVFYKNSPDAAKCAIKKGVLIVIILYAS